MKKILSILTTIVVICSIFGCSSNNKQISVYARYNDNDKIEKQIENELTELLKPYVENDNVGVPILFNEFMAEQSNKVSVNLNYSDGVPEYAKDRAKEIYDKVYKYSSEYLTNPFVEVTVRDRVSEEEINEVFVYNGNDSSTYKGKQEVIDNPIKIQSIDFSDESDKYIDVDVKILNQSGRDINYIKLNLFYYDKNGNQFRSDWTNDSAVIKNGATQIVSKMTENDFAKVSVEVDSYKYK